MSKFQELEVLTKKYPSLVIESYGGMCPLQCEGRYLDEAYYFRLRHGVASLSLGGSDVIGEPKYYGESLLEGDNRGDGYVEMAEFVKIFDALLESIKSKNNI
jgi:hypothetical protein